MVSLWVPFTVQDADQAYRLEVDVLAETLRLHMQDSSGGDTGLIELSACGRPVEG